MTLAAETRHFQMHPELLLSVIQRQAGTLGKAVLEGVMNAIDAGATRVDVGLDEESLEIRDDGQGFRSKEEIETFFEVFGQPHQSGETKIYGAFRMGRGQLFAFGHNFWRTHRYAMTVDIRREGLRYQLQDDLEHRPGCSVRVMLDTHLTAQSLGETVHEVSHLVRYCQVPVFINGAQANVDPESEEWLHVDDDVYMRLKTGSSLDVYNLGVLVCSLGAYRYGIGGTIVSRQQLRVNFARNDIMSDCPVWRRIRKALDQRKRSVLASGPLNQAAREHIVRQIMIPNNDLSDEVFWTGAWIKDVSGKAWSPRDLMNEQPLRVLTTGTASVQHEEIQTQGLAFVVRANELPWNCKASDLLSALRRIQVARLFRAQGFLDWSAVNRIQDLYSRVDVVRRTIPDKELTPSVLERLRTIRAVSQQISFRSYHSRQPNHARKIYVGRSNGDVLAWTDGSTFIVLSENLLRGGSAHTVSFWAQVSAVLVHEYSHTSSTLETHVHGRAFYELYHELSQRSGCWLTDALINDYERRMLRLKKAGKYLTQGRKRRQAAKRFESKIS